ncbi:MAG: 16S rRNA (uracil(1498)-N(3))-methyltransferase [Gammaproteobacteria bacterium]
MAHVASSPALRRRIETVHEEEASAAGRAGYRALRLGPRLLRTETAAVAALSALQAVCGDLG